MERRAAVEHGQRQLRLAAEHADLVGGQGQSHSALHRLPLNEGGGVELGPIGAQGRLTGQRDAAIKGAVQHTAGAHRGLGLIPIGQDQARLDRRHGRLTYAQGLWLCARPGAQAGAHLWPVAVMAIDGHRQRR